MKSNIKSSLTMFILATVIMATSIQSCGAKTLQEFDPEEIMRDDPETVTRNFNYTDFHGISASGIVTVQLVKSNNYKVEITLPEKLDKYLEVSVSQGILKIGWKDNLPSKLLSSLSSKQVKAEIAMPMLQSLEMSGLTSFYCTDEFNLGHREFDIRIAGSSKIGDLNVKAEKLEAKISGGSKISLSGSFDEADIQLSGSSKADFMFDAEELEIDAAGASNANCSGKFRKAEIDAAGAASLKLKGTVNSLVVESSGACRVDAMDMEADNAAIFASGSSNIRANATKSLVVEATGASTVKYKASHNANVVLREVTRSSSVSRVN